MSGPGDRASKLVSSGVPTQSVYAEGHDAAPLDSGQTYTPGSKSSARSQSLPAREPGDLDGAPTLVVSSGAAMGRPGAAIHG